MKQYFLIPANRVLPRAVIVTSLLSVLLVTLLTDPEKTELLTCQFKQLTGYSCPACGLTRSFHAFSHMRFQESFGFHLLGPVIYVVLLFLLIKFSFEIAAGKKIKLKIHPRAARIAVISFFCILFCFWIIRLIHELL